MTTVVVCDLDGVLYLHDRPVPRARQALESLEAAGVRLVFATNNSTKTPERVVSDLHRRVGFRADPAMVATAAMATAAFVAPSAPRPYVLGADGLVVSLRREGIDAVATAAMADTVIVGLDPNLTYRRLADAVLAIGAGAAFVATGTDPTYPTPEGLYPGTGAIVAAVGVATGVDPVVCGKPHPPMIALVRRLVGDADVVWVVGDRPETDLAMARAAGWAGILVLTGVTADASEVPADLRPEVVVPSIAEVPAVVLGGGAADPASPPSPHR